METILIIAPFALFYLIALQIYRTNKTKTVKGKENTWLQKQKAYKYIKLIFFTRGLNNRKWTLLLYIPLSLYLVIGLYELMIYYSYPAIPPNKMKTIEGTVETISFNRSGPDTITLTKNDGTIKKVYSSIDKDIQSRLLGKHVQVWYASHFNVFYFYDKVYQLYVDEKPFIKYGREWVYSYEKHLKNKKIQFDDMLDTFAKIAVFSFIIWFLNRKELPIHRLNRVKTGSGYQY